MAHVFDLDLNQLRVLDTLLQERSVVRAAARLERPQSSISTTLVKLRTLLGDPLFARTPQGLVPTPRALMLQGPIHEALGQLEEVLRPQRQFDPQVSDRAFHLAASDYSQFVLSGSLMELARQEAPGVAVHIRQMESTPQWNQLLDGRLDLIISGRVKPPEGLRSRLLFRDELVCVVRRRHPVLKTPWTLDAYLGLEHAEVVRSQRPTLADETLASLGLSRRIRLTVPDFLVVPFILGNTDLCFTLARRIGEPLAKLLGLQVLPLPYAAPGVTIRAYWHPRMQNDPAHRWLRALVERAAP